MFTIEVQLPEALNVSLEMVFSARLAFELSGNYVIQVQENESFALAVLGYTLVGLTITALTWREASNGDLFKAKAMTGYAVDMTRATPEQVFEIATAMMESLVADLKRRNIAVELKSDPEQFKLFLVETAEA